MATERPDPLALPAQPKPLATPTKTGSLPGAPGVTVRYYGEMTPTSETIKPVTSPPYPKGK